MIWVIVELAAGWWRIQYQLIEKEMRFLSIRFHRNILLDLLRPTCVFLIQAYTHDAEGRKKILAKAEMEIEVGERKET